MNTNENRGTALLICGKICSGKSTYTEKLRQKRHAAVLSCDELTLALFDENLGDKHEEITQKAQSYLLQRAADLLELGVNVILEWGFWTKASRMSAKNFFLERGFETEWHYIDVSDEIWRQSIEKRNREASGGAYFVDPNVAAKCAALFQPPKREEMDVWYTRSQTGNE